MENENFETNKTPETLQIGEAAEILGVDRSTIFRWIQKGYLKAVQYPSGNRKILQSSLNEILEKNKLSKPGKYKIVIVDDEQFILDMMTAQLEELAIPVEVKACTSELDALLVIGEFHPDLIFVDYRLKDVSGATIVKKIRERAQFKNVPIIMISGVIDEESMAEIGLNGFLRKPFAQEDLRKNVMNCLAIKE